MEVAKRRGARGNAYRQAERDPGLAGLRRSGQHRDAALRKEALDEPALAFGQWLDVLDAGEGKGLFLSPTLGRVCVAGHHAVVPSVVPLDVPTFASRVQGTTPAPVWRHTSHGVEAHYFVPR